MSTFTSRRVGHTHTIHLPGMPESLFPLFTPEGERKWAAGWDFVPVYPTGDIEENMIFTTASHDHSQSGAIWIVTRYEPAQYFVEYQRIEPGEKVGRIRVRCEAENDQTRVTVEYVYTALSEAGNMFLKGFTESHYTHFIQSWETAIHHFLETGTLLTHP
ncbi:MAG TPA: hypothetical protein PK530_09590 [Anaerolineales bacterium]|nr:hypothetical protein [Anaerolineales bacterium]